MLPEAPISFVSACWVSCTPLEEPSKGAPLKRMINAVQVQINKVSVNTASVCINPCLTGWVTLAVAAAFGAEPIPASLLNNPRLIPCISAMPTPPPNACSQPKAWLMMRDITSGRCVILSNTMTSARPTYPNAIIGTIMLLTRAIRRIPPKMMTRVRAVSTPPNTIWLNPNACSAAAQIVLLCTELKAKPKVMLINMAKSIPIHGCFNPFFI